MYTQRTGNYKPVNISTFKRLQRNLTKNCCGEKLTSIILNPERAEVLEVCSGLEICTESQLQASCSLDSLERDTSHVPATYDRSLPMRSLENWSCRLTPFPNKTDT